MRDDFGALWAASPSTLRRAPTPAEIAAGFPCGPPDQQLFNELMYTLSSLLSEGNGVLDAAGIVPNPASNSQLAAAIQALIAAGRGTGVALVTSQTLWVRTDGNDSTGDGSANDSAHAFATIAAAVAASFKYQTTGGAVVIRLGQTNTSANPYAAPNATLNLCGRSIQILGDTSNKDSYVISGAGLSDGTGLIFVRGGILQVSGVRFVNTGTTSTTLAAADAGLLIADHCSFAMSGTNPQAHIGGYNGNVVLNDGLNFASSAGSWLTISHGSALFGTGTITFTGTPNWTSAGVIAVYSALASPTSLGMPTISGSATGKRYSVDTVSFIHTAGAGANYFPGNVAGTGSNYD